MSFPSFASARWIRQRYSYIEETTIRISLTGSVYTFPIYRRYVERMTATIKCAGVDSQTVKGSAGATLPSIYYPDGAADTLSGTSGWTAEQPEVSDVDSYSVVTCTWTRKTTWTDTGETA